MPFSFSNISASAIIFMVLCLTVAEIVKYFRDRNNYQQSKKQAGSNSIGK